VKTSKEMFDAVKKEMKKKFDVVILAAAASDYTVKIYSNIICNNQSVEWGYNGKANRTNNLIHDETQCHIID